MYTDWQYKLWRNPLVLLPLLVFVNSSSISLYLLGNPPLTWCDPVHLGPRLLVNWPSPLHPFPIPSPFQIPDPPGFPELIVRLTMTTSRSRLPRSRTVILENNFCLHAENVLVDLPYSQNKEHRSIAAETIRKHGNHPELEMTKGKIDGIRLRKIRETNFNCDDWSDLVNIQNVYVFKTYPDRRNI